ncbi:hypothetical protein SASPL_140752 [Salvia splendens]|uniref:Uncharacterized protein n=1 Tax=Salvia splendens TaxID=180675 RepID=A0A8X8WR08_SALSN|nr:hypothetical protein SASPL_140752 [Salvia splendens]
MLQHDLVIDSAIIICDRFGTCKAVLQATVCMGLYLYLLPHFPLSRFTEPVYQEYDFWKRLSYQYMSGFTARWKYYFIWSISEASIIISGFGFSVPCSYPLYGIFKLAPGSGMSSMGVVQVQHNNYDDLLAFILLPCSATASEAKF